MTAIDAAPEMIDIAHARVTATNVRFEVADVFSWQATARFDTGFFAFWLAHVPNSRFGQFWRQLRGLVAEHGQVLLVDKHPDEPGKEEYAAGSDEIIHRRLADGSEHRLVKVGDNVILDLAHGIRTRRARRGVIRSGRALWAACRRGGGRSATARLRAGRRG
jgi:Methyltransferase domain